MKIGLTTYSLSRLVSKGEFTLCDIIRWGAENGAEHIEIAPGKECLAENAALCAEIRKTASDCGVDLSSYTIGANFIQPDEEAFRKEIERVKREVDVAARLGVTRMRHDAGWRPPAEATCRNFDADLPKLAEACAEIADYAKPFGITTSVENHGYHVQGSERVERLIYAVGRENFRTTLDVGNFLCVDEDPVSAVKNNISLASMIHFKDFYVRKNLAVRNGFFETKHGNLLRGSIVGYGDIDIPAIVEVIRNSGYDSYVSVEFEGMEECREGTSIGIRMLKELFA